MDSAIAIVACLFAIPAFFLSVYNLIKAAIKIPEQPPQVWTPQMADDTLRALNDNISEPTPGSDGIMEPPPTWDMEDTF